jgi:hypothetical protein
MRSRKERTQTPLLRLTNRDMIPVFLLFFLKKCLQEHVSWGNDQVDTDYRCSPEKEPEERCPYIVQDTFCSGGSRRETQGIYIWCIRMQEMLAGGFC